MYKGLVTAMVGSIDSALQGYRPYARPSGGWPAAGAVVARHTSASVVNATITFPEPFVTSENKIASPPRINKRGVGRYRNSMVMPLNPCTAAGAGAAGAAAAAAESSGLR